MNEFIEIITKIPQIPIPPANEIINLIFNICCGIIYLIGEVTGMGYQLANLVIFVILHPLITLTFFILWRTAKNREVLWKKFYNSSEIQSLES
tara:strand:- start:364 stop:642 length:279 start_codon:yes stop_codon:yes gene_type:complete